MTGVLNILAGFTKGGVPPPTTIGQAYGGGFYAGQISTTADGVATYYLVVAPRSSGQANNLQWGISGSGNVDVAGTKSVIDGAANTSNITTATFPAGQFCNDLVVGGESDWYLPARFELEVLYYNLKPGSTISYPNGTSYGTNDYSVPKRTSNYTSSDPAQTTASDFQLKAPTPGPETFAISDYWTSTQNTGSRYTQRISFSNGYPGAVQPPNTAQVRAIRKVAV